jgi:UDP-N-acetyl-D-glucosamine dehydrogenase
MPDVAEALLGRIARREAIVGVLGLGYVGLPLARAFARRGFRVLGFDTDSSKVDCLNQGDSYIGHVPADNIGEMRRSGFEATDDLARLAEPDALLICVPTPLTPSREPDLSFVCSSAEAIAVRLRRGQLVILESTSYPGTTRQVVLPILRGSGLDIGAEAFLAFSPEREDPGRPEHAIDRVPKVVGGLGPTDVELSCALYRAVAGGVVPVRSLEVAEASKLLENTYRAVNIALVNELKIAFVAMGIDIWDVIEAAKSKPFGFAAFYPGPGLGGPCIPVNPHYLSWAARRRGAELRVTDAAAQVNDAMPEYVVARIAAALRERGRRIEGSRILLLGMTYKRDVGDPRESPGFEILELLVAQGADIGYHDPYLPELPPMRRWPHRGLKNSPLTSEELMERDCVVVVTDHSFYDWGWIVQHAQLIVDTRNVVRPWIAANSGRVIMA